MDKIVVIVPQLAPSINGVGDHARLLAGQLHQDHGVATHFVVGDPAWEGPDVVAGFPVARVAARSAQALVAALESTQAEMLLLHYVGYGYAKRGCPVWLVDGIERWLQRDHRRRLVTFFHELYAFGPPWTSSFWLSPFQRRMVVRLSRLSAGVATNRSAYAAFISEVGEQELAAIPVLPVFSNVGEPEFVPSLSSRNRQMVVFGGPSKRARVYQAHACELASVCRCLKLEQILDIGAASELRVREVKGIPVRQLGALSSEEISHILLNSVAGFLCSPPPAFLAKSGIFAAYCAHGLLPVHVMATDSPVDGVVRNEHYWMAESSNGNLNMTQAQQIADTAHAWYQAHSTAVQATRFLHHIRLAENTRLKANS